MDMNDRGVTCNTPVEYPTTKDYIVEIGKQADVILNLVEALQDAIQGTCNSTVKKEEIGIPVDSGLVGKLCTIHNKQVNTTYYLEAIIRYVG